MANRPQEHFWQFHVTGSTNRSADWGAAYFDARARQLADTLGCRLVTSRDVSLEQTAAGKWIVGGTAILVAGKT